MSLFLLILFIVSLTLTLVVSFMLLKHPLRLKDNNINMDTEIHLPEGLLKPTTLRGQWRFTLSQQTSVSTTEWCRFFDLLCYSLKGGSDIRQTLPTLMPHLSQSLQRSLNQVMQEIHLGTSLIDALSHWHEREAHPILERFIFLIDLHYLTGGDIIRLLHQWTPQLRQQQELIKEIQHTTREARVSGVILSLLTPLLASVMALLQPHLWQEAMSNSLGQKLLGLALCLWLLGVAWTRHLTQLERL